MDSYTYGILRAQIRAVEAERMKALRGQRHEGFFNLSRTLRRLNDELTEYLTRKD